LHNNIVQRNEDVLAKMSR